MGNMRGEGCQVLQDVSVVLGSVLSLFLMMGVGYVLARRKVLGQEVLPQLSELLLYVVCPAIVVDSFQVERTGKMDGQLAVAGAALVGTYLLYMVLAQLCFSRRPQGERGLLRFASIYGNTGFMGLPLIQSVLGNEAMMVTVMSVGVFHVATWTHGAACIGGRKQISLRKAVLNPGVLSFVVAVALYLLRLRLAWPVGNAVSHLANLNTPLAMVVIGAQMAGADWRTVIGSTKLYLVSFMKLIAMPAVTILVLLPFDLDGMIFMPLVILSACPTAGVSSLFCQLFGKDSSLAAHQVTLSTLLCMMTLPLVTLVARMLG